MNKNFTFKISLIVILVVLILVAFLLRKNEEVLTPEKKPVIKEEFETKIINKVHSSENYMISPLSIAYALSILKEGASDNTKLEIEKVLGDYKFTKINNVKDRINIANALFIKNDFTTNEEYINKIKNEYNADTIYDEFKTPDKMNDWVKEKTYNMIDKITEELTPEFRFGIANAIAIDVEWKNKFECYNTNKEEFTLKNGSKMDAAFMHSSNDVSYFENKDAKGIVKDYAIYNYETGEIEYEPSDKTIELEYIAILPNNIDKYVSKFNRNTLKTIKDNLQSPSNKLDINLSLPKYTYDYTYENFKNDLISLGMKDAFDNEKASFKNISNEFLYVNEAIHKSHIELSENGTKAAAVTAFLMDTNSAFEPEKKIIDIKFNKPFIYIIKEKNNDNIWFFGEVYNPMKFEDNKDTCEVR